MENENVEINQNEVSQQNIEPVEDNVVEENVEQVENVANEIANETQIEYEQKEQIVQNQTEKPKKKNAGKMILSLSLVFVLLAVAVLSLIGTVFTKDYNYNFADPSVIKVRLNGFGNGLVPTFEKGDKEYDEIMKLYNDSFKSKILIALFGGKLNEKVTVTEDYKSMSTLNGTILEFFYNTVQELKVNGEKYEAKIISDESYITVYIQIQNVNSLTQVDAYVRYRNSSSNNYSYLKLSTYANQARLYKYLQDLQ